MQWLYLGVGKHWPMSERGQTRRRYLLSAIPVAATAGCLRLSDGDGEETTAPGEAGTETPGDGGDTATPGDGGSTTTAPETTAETTTQRPADGFGGWFDGVDSFDGVRDLTGQSQVDVAVGAEGNGAAFAYDPTATVISRGATLVWTWTGAGGGHNLRVEDQPAGGEFDELIELHDEAGFTYRLTFETPGTYLYYCGPHLQQGMKGAIVVDDEGLDDGDGGGGDGELAVELVEEDTRSDLEAAVEAAQTLAERDAPFVCGPFLPGAAVQAFSEVFPPAEVVGCSPSAPTTELTDVADDGFGFRTVPSSVWEGRALARVMAENEIETAAVVYADVEYGQVVAESFAEAFGVTNLTDAVAVPRGPEDHTDALERVLDTEPGALVVAAFPTTGIPLLRQYYEEFAGSAGVVLLPDGLKNAAVAEALAEYDIAGTHLGASPGRGPNREEFVDLYREAYGEAPGQYAAEAYDAAVVGLTATAAAGENDGAAVRDRIRTVANPGGDVFGPRPLPEVVRDLAAGEVEAVWYQGAGSVVNFDENGDVAVQNHQMWQFEDGGIVEEAVFEIPEDSRLDPGGPTADVVGSQGRELRIGGLYPLSGPLERFGRDIQRGARLPILQLQGEV